MVTLRKPIQWDLTFYIQGLSRNRSNNVASGFRGLFNQEWPKRLCIHFRVEPYKRLYVYAFEYTWRNLIICLLRSWAGRSSRGVLARWFLNNLWGTLQVYKFKFGRPNRIILNLISGRRYLHTTPRIAHCGQREDARNQPRGWKTKRKPIGSHYLLNLSKFNFDCLQCYRLMQSIFGYLNIYDALRRRCIIQIQLLN